LRGVGEDFDCCRRGGEERWEEGPGAVAWERLQDGCEEAEGEVYLAFDGVDNGEMAGYGVLEGSDR